MFIKWWKKNWRWFLAVTSASFSTILLFVFYALQKKEEVAKLKRKMAIKCAEAKIEGLAEAQKLQREAIKSNLEAQRQVKKELVEIQRKTVAAVKDVSQMTDKEVAIAFRNLKL